jgi:hypothetical protein
VHKLQAHADRRERNLESRTLLLLWRLRLECLRSWCSCFLLTSIEPAAPAHALKLQLLARGQRAQQAAAHGWRGVPGWQQLVCQLSVCLHAVNQLHTVVWAGQKPRACMTCQLSYG